MADVVNNGTSKLTDEDRKSMAAYLQALPPIMHKVTRKRGGIARAWAPAGSVAPGQVAYYG